MSLWTLSSVRSSRISLGGARKKGGNCSTPAWDQKSSAGAGGDERQAQLHAALSCDEALLKSHSTGSTGSSELAGSSSPHRMLRRFTYSRHRQSGQYGGVGRRQDEEIRLSEIHHQDGCRQ